MLLSGDPSDPALVEWKIALTSLDARQLADFLESPTPKAKRMRISSPFFWPDSMPARSSYCPRV